MEINQTVVDLYEHIPDAAEAITEDEYLLSGVYRGPDGTVYFAGGFDCPTCGCPAVIIRQAEERTFVECVECGLYSEYPPHAR